MFVQQLLVAVFVCTSFQHRMSAEGSANLCGEAEQTLTHKHMKLKAQYSRYVLD